jgi:hypothetical protein
LAIGRTLGGPTLTCPAAGRGSLPREPHTKGLTWWQKRASPSRPGQPCNVLRPVSFTPGPQIQHFQIPEERSDSGLSAFLKKTKRNRHRHVVVILKHPPPPGSSKSRIGVPRR